MIALFAIIFLTGYDASSVAAATTEARPTEPADRLGLGSCRTKGGFFELRRIALLKNQTLDFKDRHGPIRITLDGQKVRITELDAAPDQGTYIVNIGNVAGGEPDVDLTLGLLDDEPVVYWRETFIHRSHRQGVFKIVGQSLVSLCEGRGGTDAVD